jgi:hypothetical protein
MSSTAKERAELLFKKRQEVGRALAEYQAREQTTREQPSYVPSDWLAKR